MLIDPWEVIIGTLLLFALLGRAVIALLILALRLCVWTYRGAGWTLAQYQARHARRARDARTPR